MPYIILLVSLATILCAAGLFTNAVEWLGRKLDLSEGAVGSILAAVGTALPETMIPIIAIVFGGGGHEEEIGIGAILGAPLMLSTLALMISGLSVIIFAARKQRPIAITVDESTFTRDLGFFLIVYTVAILAALIPQGLKPLAAVALVGAYGVYAYYTITKEEPISVIRGLSPLAFARRASDPPMGLVVAQLAIALGGIIIGASYFVVSIRFLATTFGLSPFILSVAIAPVATELPEKFNSVIWLSQGKDTLALGNITGAMVFQSSIIPAVGILLTPWRLGTLEIVAALLAILSAGTVYLTFRLRRKVSARLLLLSGTYYVLYFVYVALFPE